MARSSPLRILPPLSRHGDFPLRHRNGGREGSYVVCRAAAVRQYIAVLSPPVRRGLVPQAPVRRRGAGISPPLRPGGQEARDVLIERNLRLVAHIIKKYYTQSGDQEDLISIGTIGLIKGITSFDPGKGARLATYAARCIENATLS